MAELDLSPLDLLEIPDLEKYVVETMLVTDEGEAIEIPPEEQQQIIDELTTEKYRIQGLLNGLGGDLEGKFSEFSKRRNLKEKEWLDAILQHEGRSPGILKSKEDQIFNNSIGSVKPVINITRQKDNLAIARMRDIQFPLGGDYNFRIVPHPNVDVELAKGNPDPNVQQQVQQFESTEHEKARRMQEEIQQQLVKARYGNKARESMRDWVVLGTAILKGPVIDVDKIKKYVPQRTSDGQRIVQELQYNVTEFPNVFRVDPRYFYVDPDALCPEELFEAIEIHPMSKTELIGLQHNQAFIKSQLREAVMEAPEGLSSIDAMPELSVLDSDANLKNRYIVKEYHGPIPKGPLRDLGMIDDEQFDDPFQEFYGEVWFVKGTVIRVSLNPIEGMDQIPYYLIPWEKDDASIYGHGMPWMMRDAQRVAKAGWQMLLDNAGLSAGPQMVVHREMIKPADGKWEIAPQKLWYFTEYGGNVNEAFQFFSVPNNQPQIAQVVEMAMQFGDLESESPMIQQNLIPQANNTASGQAMMMTIGNVTQRDKSQLWDDYGTRPLITNFYHYNMQYGEDDRAKGNFDIELAGATETVDAQLKAQEVERILSLASANPEYMLHIKPGEAFREVVAAARIGSRILRTEEEVEQEKQRIAQEQQNQGPSPEEMRAQATLIREQTRQAEMQQEAEWKEKDRMFEAQKMQMEHEQKLAEINSNLITQQQKTDLEVLKLAISTDRDAAKLAQDLNLKSLQEATKLAIAENNADMKRAEMQLKREKGSGI